MRQHRAAAQDRAEEVHPHGVLPLVPGDVLDGPFRPVDAGVVHEHVDAREALERVADECVHGLGLGDVGRGGLDRARVGRDRLELGPRAVEGGRIARTDEHPGAGGEVRSARSRVRAPGCLR